jgi:DNA uptake protein ComE-like DNA-binding protein
MPIAKIVMPPIMGADRKLYWDEIELSEKEFNLLKSQGIVTDKTENLSVTNSSELEQTNLPPSGTGSNESSSSDSEKEDPVLDFFNTASVEVLSRLKNIGTTRAEKIKTHAPYKTIKEVQDQTGLSVQGWQAAIAELPK